jgi:hypothetical protein
MWRVGGNSSGWSRLAVVTSMQSGSPSYLYVSDVPQPWQKVLLTPSEERKSAGSPETKERLL